MSPKILFNPRGINTGKDGELNFFKYRNVVLGNAGKEVSLQFVANSTDTVYYIEGNFIKKTEIKTNKFGDTEWYINNEFITNRKGQLKSSSWGNNVDKFLYDNNNFLIKIERYLDGMLVRLSSFTRGDHGQII